MKNFVACTLRKDLRLLLESQVREITGAIPPVKESFEELSSFLELVGESDLVVIDDPAGSPELFVLLKKLRSSATKLGSVLVLTEGPVPEGVSQLLPSDFEGLLTALRSSGQGQAPQPEDYISIPVESFLHFDSLPFDLYIRLPQGKYLRRIPANESLDEKTLVTFLEKGIKELHFERSHNKDFSRLLIGRMISKVETKYGSHMEGTKATQQVFLTTREIVQSLGLPPRIIDVCDKMMNKITEEVTQNRDKFANFIKGLKAKEELDFQYRLIELTSFIGTQILDDQNSPGKSVEIRTLVFVSLFCDISLKDPELSRVRTEEALAKLWPEDQKQVREHALRSSELSQAYKGAPLMAVQVILEHHGSRNGEGLPAVPAQGLHQLSMCFIAAQRIAFALLTSEGQKPVDVVFGLLTAEKTSPLYPWYLRFAKSSRLNLMVS